jgi:hypothetical protein
MFFVLIVTVSVFQMSSVVGSAGPGDIVCWAAYYMEISNCGAPDPNCDPNDLPCQMSNQQANACLAAADDKLYHCLFAD